MKEMPTIQREQLVRNPERLRELVLSGRERLSVLRIPMRQYIDPTQSGYSSEEVKKDEDAVALKLANIHMEELENTDVVKMMAELLEIVFAEQADRSEWLGPDCESYPTSTYDDLFNGIDTIIEFFPENGTTSNEYLGIGFDVTLSSDYSVLNKKIRRVYKTLREQGLSHVKYFEPQNSHGKFGLDLPRLLVGADMSHVQSAATMWAGLSDDSLGIEIRKSLRARLAGHPIQYVLIESIYIQLTHFVKYLEKKIKEETVDPTRYEFALSKYKELQTIFEKIRNVKVKSEAVKNYLEADSMYLALRDTLTKLAFDNHLE